MALRRVCSLSGNQTHAHPHHRHLHHPASRPRHLAAIHRPLYALAYQMAKQPVFKSSFMGLVYDALCDYTPNYAAREQTLI